MGEMKAASFVFFRLLPVVLLLFQSRLSPSDFPHVDKVDGIGPGSLFLSDVRLGRFPVLPSSRPPVLVLAFFLSPLLSPLADSSDKLSLSSARMALGENQCPYVSSAALHRTDEG